MPEPFTITTTTGSIRLDAQHRSRAVFSVTNVSGRALRGRARVMPDGAAQTAWFTIAGDAEREFAPSATEQYAVDVAPADAPAGTYRFRLDALGSDDPDEVQAHGQWVSFEVAPAPKPRPIPWLWIIVAAAAVVLLAGGGALAFFLTHRSGTLSPDPSTEDFGTVNIGSTLNRSVTVRNTGANAASVTASITGAQANQFRIVTDGCAGKRLEPDTTCPIRLTFAPNSVGSKTAELRLDSDNAESESVALAGTGRGVPLATISPATVVANMIGGLFPNPIFVQGAVTLVNTGTGDLHVASVTVVGSGYQASLPQNTCTNRTLAPRASCSVTVLLSGAFGATPGQLVIKDDAAPGQQQVPIVVVL